MLTLDLMGLYTAELAEYGVGRSRICTRMCHSYFSSYGGPNLSSSRLDFVLNAVMNAERGGTNNRKPQTSSNHIVRLGRCSHDRPLTTASLRRYAAGWLTTPQVSLLFARNGFRFFHLNIIFHRYQFSVPFWAIVVRHHPLKPRSCGSSTQKRSNWSLSRNQSRNHTQFSLTHGRKRKSASRKWPT